MNKGLFLKKIKVGNQFHGETCLYVEEREVTYADLIERLDLNEGQIIKALEFSQLKRYDSLPKGVIKLQSSHAKSFVSYLAKHCVINEYNNSGV